MKLCPFCGSAALISRAFKGHTAEVYICCEACTACGPSAKTLVEAEKVWNERYRDPAIVTISPALTIKTFEVTR